MPADSGKDVLIAWSNAKKNGHSIKKSRNIILLPAILLNKQHTKKGTTFQKVVPFLSIFVSMSWNIDILGEN